MPIDRQHKILQNVIICYYLIKDQIEHSEDGLECNHASHKKDNAQNFRTKLQRVCGNHYKYIK